MKSKVLIAAALLLAACNQNNPIPAAVDHVHGADFEVEFTITVENVSDESALPTPLAPIVWAVDDKEGLFFKEGDTASAGLQALAEDGDPEVLFAELTQTNKGHFETPLAPGESRSYKFTAKPGAHLSFAGMMVESNDVFVAPAAEHIELFGANNEPRAKGDLTLALWDAGTEVNQEPGKGADQAPRQSAGNTGADENGKVMHLDEVNDGFSYPEVAKLFHISLDHNDDHAHEGEDEHENEAEHDHDHE